MSLARLRAVATDTALPVVLGLVVIATVFGSLNEHFLSAENLTNLALQMAATGTIALGVIMVLLLGEIDLSVGSVSGLCAVEMTVLTVRHDVHPALAVAVAIASGTAIGLLHGVMVTYLRMPSFVVTLSGLIGWQGLMLFTLGKGGTIDLPYDGAIAGLSDTWLAPGWAWAVVLAIVAGYAGVLVLARRARVAAGLPVAAWQWSALRIAGLAAVLVTAVSVLTADRGVPLTFLVFGSLVVALDLVLRHTVGGRWIYAVGGNAEAARRAGINVRRVRIVGFMASSALAATGGILAASRLAAVNQSSGGSDTLLIAVAAAVIGGASLYGGKGRTYAALLGILVLQAVTNGMLLLNVDSSVRFMVTAGVLALAVAIDSVARPAPQ